MKINLLYNIKDKGITKREYDHLVDYVVKEVFREHVDVSDGHFVDDVNPEEYLL